jgi:hypothetical protein
LIIASKVARGDRGSGRRAELRCDAVGAIGVCVGRREGDPGVYTDGSSVPMVTSEVVDGSFTLCKGDTIATVQAA